MANTPRSPTSDATLARGNQPNHFADAGKAEDVYFWGSFAAAGLEQDIKQKCNPGDYVVVNIDTKEHYVVGSSLSEAIALFRKSFPESRGYVCRVGEPLPLRTI